MSKKIKIICDDIEYNLETLDDKTILDIALDNNIDVLIHVKVVYVALV